MKGFKIIFVSMPNFFPQHRQFSSIKNKAFYLMKSMECLLLQAIQLAWERLSPHDLSIVFFVKWS